MEFIVGIVGSYLLNPLKEKYGLEGKAAMLLTAAASVVVALGFQFYEGKLSFSDFSLENFANAFSQVLAAATVAYKLFPQSAGQG